MAEKDISEAPKSSEELELEKLVFGDVAGFEAALIDFDTDVSDELSDAVEDEDKDTDLFFVDNDGEISDSQESKESLEFDDDGAETASASEDLDETAWADSDDDTLEVSLKSSTRLRKLRETMEEDTVSGRDYERRLRSQFLKLHPKPKWATTAVDDDVMDVDQPKDALRQLLSRSSTWVSSRKRQLLPAGNLDIQRLADITKDRPVPAAVQSLDFHPSQPFILEAGYDRTLRVYGADGKTNSLTTSLHIRDSPFQTARWHPDGRRVFAGGRRRYMWMWDVETGALDKVSRMYGHAQTQRSMEKFVLSADGEFVALIGGGGWVNFLSAHSGQWIAGAKADDGVVVDLSWIGSNEVSIVTSSGDVFVWDMTARQFRSRWRDVGGTGTTAIAQTEKWTALGSSNGMVSVYDETKPLAGGVRLAGEPETRKPSFVLENLVTPISTLAFSPDGQMLLMASRATRDALRIAHVPSFSVFRNWPTSVTPLGRVTAAGFAPTSGMLAAGNEGGNVRLWSLNHYL